MVRKMLSVLMDGITDTNMLLDYASDSETQEQKNWFHAHAKSRMDQLLNDYLFVKNQLGLEKKISEGDEIADALCSHLDHEINLIKNKMNF